LDLKGPAVWFYEVSVLQYHVWFNLKPGVAESDGLEALSDFLDGVCASGESLGYRLLRNKGGPKTKLPTYHALIEFESDAQLSAAMRNQAARGIHAGPHGGVIDVVTDFHVEIFTSIPLKATQAEAEWVGGCAI
jgi:hypothetical protein